MYLFRFRTPHLSRMLHCYTRTHTRTHAHACEYTRTLRTNTRACIYTTHRHTTHDTQRITYTLSHTQDRQNTQRKHIYSPSHTRTQNSKFLFFYCPQGTSFSVTSMYLMDEPFKKNNVTNSDSGSFCSKKKRELSCKPDVCHVQ